jgi:FkbM family methyltransferase
MYYNKLMTRLDFWRKLGPKGLRYLLCLRNKALCPLPLSLPIFGLITTDEEMLNIRGNIYKGQLRDPFMEKWIRKAAEPVIVDCGINVGITVRWWFYLNPKSVVYGIDMMQEAHDFTVKALPEHFKKSYIPITVALDSETNRIFDVRYNEPLFGGNSLKAAEEKYLHNRNVCSSTLDDCLGSYHIENIDLLKVDIEGSEVPMFRGARQTLGKVKNILLEWHDPEERKGSITFLQSMGFALRKEYRRHIWFEKKIGNYSGIKIKNMINS